MQYTDAAYYNRCHTQHGLCLYLCVLGTWVRCVKMAQLIKMPFGGLTHVCPRNHRGVLQMTDNNDRCQQPLLVCPPPPTLCIGRPIITLHLPYVHTKQNNNQQTSISQQLLQLNKQKYISFSTSYNCNLYNWIYEHKFGQQLFTS